MMSNTSLLNAESIRIRGDSNVPQRILQSCFLQSDEDVRLAVCELGVFVEGGGVTVSRFLAAGCLDRLHVTVAPVLLGSGVPAFTLPEVARATLAPAERPRRWLLRRTLPLTSAGKLDRDGLAAWVRGDAR